MMLNCPECLAHKWLVFAPSERMVCADCGYTYPADEPEDPGQTDDQSPVDRAPDVQIIIRKTSSGKTYAYVYKAGKYVGPITIAKAKDLLASGEATTTQHGQAILDARKG